MDYIFSRFQRKVDRFNRATKKAERFAARAAKAAEKEKKKAEADAKALAEGDEDGLVSTHPPTTQATKPTPPPPLPKPKSPDEFSFLATAHFLEIYNERVFDLLDSATPAVNLREDVAGRVYVDGAVEMDIADPVAATKIIETGQRHRHVGELGGILI